MADTEDPRRPRAREARLRGIARRLFRELEGAEEGAHEEAPRRPREEPRVERPHAGEEDGPDGHRAEAWALLGALLETGDKVKVEIVRMLAREVRGYLEALELHKDLHHLMTHYSLEVHASLHLKPLRDEAPAPPSVGLGLRRREQARGGAGGPEAPHDEDAAEQGKHAPSAGPRA